jgi:NAD(P)H-nitrite reductase large subunit
VNAEKKLYRKVVVQGNRLIGAIFLGDLRDIGVVRNAIAQSVDVSPFKSRMATMPLNFARDILVPGLDCCNVKE